MLEGLLKKLNDTRERQKAKIAELKAAKWIEHEEEAVHKDE